MSDMDDAMGQQGQSAEQLNAAEIEQQVRALIPALTVYEVTRKKFVVNKPDTVETFQVLAHTMTTDTTGKVLFFTLRFQKPHQLMNLITRIVGGNITDVVDTGVVPESRIIH